MNPRENTKPVKPDLNAVQVWDTWPDEHRSDYFMFTVYRDSAYPNGYAGPWAKRSIHRTCQILSETHNVKTTPHALYNLSTRFAWSERARAYDLFLDSAAAGALVSEVVRTKRAQLRRLAKLAELGEAELDRHTERANQLNRGPEIVPVTRVKDVTDLIVQVTKAERLVMGESTETVGAAGAVSGAVMDLSNASLDDLREIEKLRKRFERKST